MDEAAPAQAAVDMSPDDARALEVLRVIWGEYYAVGYDDERGWWASRHGRVGHIIVAPSAEILNKMIREEYGTGLS